MPTIRTLAPRTIGTLAPLDAWAVASSLPYVATPATTDADLTASMLADAERAWGTLDTLR